MLLWLLLNGCMNMGSENKKNLARRQLYSIDCGGRENPNELFSKLDLKMKIVKEFATIENFPFPFKMKNYHVYKKEKLGSGFFFIHFPFNPLLTDFAFYYQPSVIFFVNIFTSAT